MRNTIKILALVAAMAAATSLSAHAGGYYGRGFGHGFYGHGYYGHGYYGRGFGHGGFGRSYYGPSRRSNRGAVRIEVEPKNSRKAIQVYVDEGHVGVVNDFDGAFQRLYLAPGKHEIELRLDGYKTIKTAILLRSGSTYHLRGEMELI